jgi:hypothetical protein
MQRTGRLLHPSSCIRHPGCICQHPATLKGAAIREFSPWRSVVEYAASSAVAVDESGAGSGDRLRIAAGGQ